MLHWDFALFSRQKPKLNILCIIEANPKVYNKFVVNFGEVVVFYLTVRIFRFIAEGIQK